MSNTNDARDIANILAAIRVAQRHHDDFANMPHFEDVDPMDEEELEDLCERINISDAGESTSVEVTAVDQ